MWRKLILTFLTLIMLLSPCFAVGLDEVISSQAEAVDLDALQDAAEPYLGDMRPESADLEDGLQNILDTGTSELNGIVRKALHSSMLLLAVILLCGIAGSMVDGMKLGQIPVVPMVGVLAITTIAITDVRSLLGLGESTLSNMTDFANVLFPVVTALTAATGSITGAAVRELTAMLFSDILMNLMSSLLVPLVYAYLAAGVAYAALGNEGLKRVASFTKWLVGILLTMLLMVFVGYLSISGVIAGQTDAVTIKATKFAMSSTIPVVGGILSDAAETVLAGAGILRGTVGVYGMLVILAMCLAPFLQLGVHYLSYKLAAALASTVADSRLGGLIDHIGTAFGLVLGMTGAGALVLLVSLISALSVMNG